MSEDEPTGSTAASGSANAGSGGPGGWAPLIKHWATFLGVLGVLVAISQWQVRWVNVYFAQATASVMAFILKVIGIQGKATGIRVTSTVCKFQIIGECTAYYPIAIYIAAVLAFPAPWGRRVLGVLLGIPAILLINQVRLVSLCYLLRAFPEHFETIHIVIWQSLIIFFTVLIWILWVTTLARRS